MRIEEEDFRLDYDGSCNRFDLYMTKVIHANDPEKRRTEPSIYGYSMTLEGALKKIINNRISKKNKETYSLKEYLKEYKQHVDDLNYIIENLKPIKNG